MFLLILEREEGERERNNDQMSPVCTQTGDRTPHLGIHPERGSNRQLFSVWVGDIPTNWGTQLGPTFYILN